MPLDLDAYCARIGYTGARVPTLDTLRAVHAAHALSIPFENLDPLLRRPVPLDVDALEAKLVRGRRGGWCFEQNHVFRAALDALGFRTTALVGRVLWNASVTVGGVTARSHMLLRVDLDGARWIVDVGFGGCTLTAPLALDVDAPQDTLHEPFRLVALDGGERRLEALVQGEWKPLYRFDEQPQHTLDYEVASWYLCTNPRSHFLSNLVVARPIVGGRRTLRNNVFTEHRLGGPSTTHTLDSADALREVLEDTFDLALPDDAGLQPMLERVAATAAS